MTDISQLRKSYERAELSEEASHADPLKQFAQWLAEAIDAQVPEPNAMTLATVASVIAFGSGTCALIASVSH
jgi:pyridoxamine 5'-phosphate oxidase